MPFVQKYDVASAGMGALTVTGYCVWRGQDPWTALTITLAATVAALVRLRNDLFQVLNETPFGNLAKKPVLRSKRTVKDGRQA